MKSTTALRAGIFYEIYVDLISDSAETHEIYVETNLWFGRDSVCIQATICNVCCWWTTYLCTVVLRTQRGLTISISTLRARYWLASSLCDFSVVLTCWLDSWTRGPSDRGPDINSRQVCVTCWLTQTEFTISAKALSQKAELFDFFGPRSWYWFASCLYDMDCDNYRGIM